MTSASVAFPITDRPNITSLNPSSRTAGTATFTLTVNGTGFATGAVVQWNGQPLSTTFVGATQLTATVPSRSDNNTGLCGHHSHFPECDIRSVFCLPINSLRIIVTFFSPIYEQLEAQTSC